MGIRGHVLIRQPEYGNCTLSSWASEYAMTLLRENGITIYERVDGDHWEIEVDDNLHNLANRLEKDPSLFDKTMEGEISCEGHGKELASILREGIEAAERCGYDTIAIDWW